MACCSSTTSSPFIPLGYPGADATYLTGIRDGYITGFFQQGEAEASFVWWKGKFYLLGDPSASTFLYGPCSLRSGRIRVVGNVAGPSGPIGVIYQGWLDGEGNWTHLGFPGEDGTSLPTIFHSTDGDLVAGNWTDLAGIPHPVLYDLVAQSWIPIQFPGLKLTDEMGTVYSVMYNGGSSYTLGGGVRGQAYLLDYNLAPGGGSFSKLRLYNYQNVRKGVTHFNGICKRADGCGYYAVGDWVAAEGDTSGAVPFVADISATWGASWRRLSFATSANSVDAGKVVGVYTEKKTGATSGYIYQIPTCPVDPFDGKWYNFC
jgi:hypothetical protein